MESRRLLGLIAAVAILCVSSPCFGYYWSLEYVDWYGQAGLDSSLALTPSAKYIAYTASGDLFLAADTGAGWTLEYVAAAGFGGGWLSLAAPASGSPLIAFIDDSGAAPVLRSASKSGGVWSVEQVDSAGWLPDYVSLKLDNLGRPAIAYSATAAAGSPAVVKLARRSAAGAWTIETVATIGDVNGPSLAFDGSGLPAVSFVDVTSGVVKLARRSAVGSWTVETVAGTSMTPARWYTSLAFTAGPAPCVAYYAGAGDYLSLYYASKPSSSWVREVVQAQLPAGSPQYCSLAVDAYAKPAIAYLDSATQTLGVARRLAGKWYYETVDGAYMSGYRPSLVFDAESNPAIAYVDAGFSAVKYASTQQAGLESAKLLPDGSLLSFSGVAASTASGELSERLYVQSPARSSGVQIYLGPQVPPAVARGSLLRVEGRAGTRDGERCVLSPEITLIQAGEAPVPLNLTNTAAGGDGFHYDPFPPAIGQQGVEGGFGLNNIGLLVRTWGRVTAVAGGYLYIDDGSGLLDGTDTNGSPNAGVRVVAATAGFVPGDFVCVTGISSCFTTGAGTLARQILPRDSAGLVPCP